MVRKIAVISGASSGIGKGVAEECVKQGIFAILLGRNMAKLKEMNSVLGESNSDYFYLDIAETHEIEKVISKILNKYSKIDILVNCAGVPEFGSVIDMDITKVNKVVNVNLIGTMFLVKEVAKNMIQRRSGQIIIIDSIAGIKGFEYGSAYVVSKFGQVGFSQILWAELRKYEIKVCSIRPGLVDTQFYNQFDMKRDRSMGLSVDDISYLVMTVINQSEQSNISEVIVRPLKKDGQNLFFDILNEKYGEK